MVGTDNLDDQLWQEVERTIAAIRADPLDAHAIEIGRLCLVWSRLEVSVMMLLDALLDIPDRTTVNILMGTLDFRGKLQALIPLAFSKKRNDAWFERLHEEVNNIDNALRTERNRMVHDFWTIEPGSPARRMQLAPKVVKDQRDKKLTLANVKPVTPNEITLLIVRIAKAGGAIDLLFEEYRGQPTWPRIQPAPPPPGNPARDRNQSTEPSPPAPSRE